MKHYFFIVIIFFTVFSAKAQSDSFIGSWEGTLSFGSMKVRLVFHIAEKDSNVTATFDSPDQGARGLTFDKVQVNATSILLGFTLNNAQFDGVLQDDNKIIEGTWTQSGQKLPLSMNRTSILLRTPRPQEPVPPFEYDVEEVTFSSGDKEIILAGTLTKPKGSGIYPAMVLVTGSGPQNRDEEILEHKPFAVIADYFSKKGWAVLRYDDRGVGKSKGDFASATTANFTKDAISAIKFLRTRKDIEKANVGICGHSEGGIIAQQIAADGITNPSFIMLLAGSGINGADILALQNKAILEASGVDTALAAWYARYLRTEVYPTIMNDKPRESVANTLAESLDRMATTFSAEELHALGINTNVTKAMLMQLLTPWMREFLQYDPRNNLRKITCNVLALFGEKDKQVLPEVNAQAIKKNCTKAEVHIFPQLNHLFQTAETGLPMEYGGIQETFSPIVLNKMEEWLNKIKK